MANVNNKGSLIKTQIKTFSNLLKEKRKTFEALLPAHIKLERLLVLAVGALKNSPGLLECDQVSVMASLMQSGALGLEVNSPLQEAYLVPFYNTKRKCKEAQLIVGYPGLIKLMRQSQLVAGVEAHCFYANEPFEIQRGTETKLMHIPIINADRGKLMGAYCIVTFTRSGSTPLIEVMDIDAIEKIHQRSQAKEGFGWKDNYDDMARKCPIRRISKYVPKSVETATAVVLDGRAATGESQMDLIDPEILAGLGGDPEDYALAETGLNPEDEIKPEDMKAGDPADHQDIKRPPANKTEPQKEPDQPAEKESKAPAPSAKSDAPDEAELAARKVQQERFISFVQLAHEWASLPVAMKIMDGLSRGDKYMRMRASDLEAQLDIVVRLIDASKETTDSAKTAEASGEPTEQQKLGAKF